MDIKELAKMGGEASAKSRFNGKSKKQISRIMSKIRLTKIERKYDQNTTA